MAKATPSRADRSSGPGRDGVEPGPRAAQRGVHVGGAFAVQVGQEDRVVRPCRRSPRISYNSAQDGAKELPYPIQGQPTVEHGGHFVPATLVAARYRWVTGSPACTLTALAGRTI